MAKDGDRHQLGDPISRIADHDTGIHSVISDTTDPVLLTDEELRRQRVNLDQITQEAPLRGTPPDLQQQAEVRLRLLNIEYRRRTVATSH